MKIYNKICLLVLMTFLILSMCSCKSNNDENSQKVVSIEETQQEVSQNEDVAIIIGSRTLTINDFLFYVKYYLTYISEDIGNVSDWSAEFIDGMSYQDYIFDGAIQWLKYDEAIRIKTDELNCNLDEEDIKKINSQWDTLVNQYDNQDMLLQEMKDYYCNEQLYKNMIGGFLLSDKLKNISNFEEEIETIAINQVEVSFTEMYDSINLNELENF